MGQKRGGLAPGILGILTVLAVFLASTALLPGPAEAETPEETASLPPSPSPVLHNEASPDSSPSPTLRVLLTDGETVELELEDYVAGVLCAEMPASFQPEALKAQAVAARTYALRRKADGVHPDADVCADPACCQGCRLPEDWEALWGTEAAFYGEKLRQAARDTAGEVLTYEGALIQAAFHASSVGTTEDAVQVWGRSVPYLQAVDTPETGESVPNLESWVTVPLDQFQALAAEKWPTADLSGPPEDWVRVTEKSPSGRNTALLVGGAPVRGSDFRFALGLRSTDFQVEAEPGALVFRVWGYGHGVGMSQYGAQALAQAGWSCRDILAHYYPGTDLSRLPVG